MRNSIEVIVFGNSYKVMQFAATNGVTLLCGDDNHNHPIRMLDGTEVMTSDGWVGLNSVEAINRFVTDSAGVTSPTTVLDALCARIYLANFGFMSGWKPVEIPRRLISPVDGDMEAPRMDPVISLVVMAGKATIKELEEYYSTEDAFKMYDMIAVDNLNKALGSEAAMAEAKSRNKRR